MDDKKENIVAVETPKEISGHISLAIPIIVVFRPGFDMTKLVKWTPPPELQAVVSRAIRESFKAEYGQVKTICGGLVQQHQLWEVFAGLGLAHDRLPDITKEESSVHCAEFIYRYFDAEIVYEQLGKLLKGGVEK